MRVFLSYSRRDTAAADRMVADLEAHSIDVGIDRRDLPYGEAWQAELQKFIQQADTIVWLASDASVNSRWCKWELGEAQRLNKRLLPVRILPLGPEHLPEALGRIHVLPVEGVYDPALHLDDLVRAIETDRAWMETHTRLADRAAEWIARSRSADRLLRGRALHDAEGWRDGKPERAPSPSSDTLDLLLQSRRATTRGLRGLVGLAVLGFFVMTGLALFAGFQAIEAQRQAGIAQANEYRSVANLADTAVATGERQDAIKLALAAWPRSPASSAPRLESALAVLSAATALPLSRSMSSNSSVAVIDFNETSNRLLSLDAAGMVQVWDIASESELGAWQLDAPQAQAIWNDDGTKVFAWTSHDVASEVLDLATGSGTPMPGVNSAQFIDESALLLIGRTEVRVVDSTSGSEASPAIRPGGEILTAQLDQSGTRLLTWTTTGSFGIWDLATGTSSAKHQLIADRLASVFLSQDQTRALTVSDYGDASVWDVETGRQLATQTGTAAAALAPDGGHAAFADKDGYVHYWNIDTNVSGPAISHSDDGYAYRIFGDMIITYGYDGYIRAWNGPSGDELYPPLRHEGGIKDCWFTAGGTRLISASLTGTIQVWDAIAGQLLVATPLRSGKLTSAFVPLDDDRMITGSEDGTLRVWDLRLGYPRALPFGVEGGTPLYNTDGSQLLLVVSDGSIRTHSVDTLEEIAPRLRENVDYSPGFEQAPDGSRYASWSGRVFSLWDARTGERLQTITVPPQEIRGLRFSPASDSLLFWGERVVGVRDTAQGKPPFADLTLDAQVESARFVSDGREMLITLNGGRAELRRADTGTLIGAVTPPEKVAFATSIDPQVTSVVTWYGRMIYGWDIRTGTLRYAHKMVGVNDVSFSDDGHHLLVSRTTGGVVELEAVSGDQVGPAMDDRPYAWSAIYTSAGILSVGPQGLSLWDRESKQRLPLSWETTRELGSGVSLDASGSRILTSGYRSAQIWDLTTGLPIGPEMVNDGPFVSHPTQAQLLSRTSKAANLWDTSWPAGDMVEVACAMLPSVDGRVDLSDLERKYGIKIDQPVCTADQLAVPIDWSTIERMSEGR